MVPTLPNSEEADMRKHLTCTASTGLAFFVGSRLAILIIGITAFHIAQSPELTPSAPPTTYGCDGTNAARCTAIVNYCDALGGLDDGIVGALAGAMAVYDLGFTELETSCEETIARGSPLDDSRMQLRTAYRTVLFEHINDLGQRLLERNEALETLRAAARAIGDESMLAELRLDEHHDLVREALDASIQSLQVIRTIIEDASRDVFLPPCGGDVQCWKI